MSRRVKNVRTAVFTKSRCIIMQKISGVLDIIASIVITCTRYTCLMIVNYYYINIILKMILIIGKTCFKKMKQDVYLSRFHYFSITKDRFNIHSPSTHSHLLIRTHYYRQYLAFLNSFTHKDPSRAAKLNSNWHEHV